MVRRGRDDSVWLGWVGKESSSSPLSVSNLLVDCSLRAWLQLCHITPVVVQSYPTLHLKTPDEQWWWGGAVLCRRVLLSLAAALAATNSLAYLQTGEGISRGLDICPFRQVMSPCGLILFLFVRHWRWRSSQRRDDGFGEFQISWRGLVFMRCFDVSCSGGLLALPSPPGREFFTISTRLACPSPPLSLLACAGIMI